jgi:hypothetical protein
MSTHKEHCYHNPITGGPEFIEQGAPCICNEPVFKHTSVCEQYWERGLECTCIVIDEGA